MSKCTACQLHKNSGTTTNAAEGWGNREAKLVIVMDCPGSHLAEKLLIWILRKLSLTADDVWVDYTFKCPTEKTKKAELLECHKTCWEQHPRHEIIYNHSIVLAGNWSSSFVGGQTLKNVNGRKDPEGIWYVYSFNYLLMNPAECLRTWRVIYKASEEAGLKPAYCSELANFQFPSKKV
jgi:uracil-DNA glycosylase